MYGVKPTIAVARRAEQQPTHYLCPGTTIGRVTGTLRGGGLGAQRRDLVANHASHRPAALHLATAGYLNKVDWASTGSRVLHRQPFFMRSVKAVKRFCSGLAWSQQSLLRDCAELCYPPPRRCHDWPPHRPQRPGARRVRHCEQCRDGGDSP